MNVTLSYVANNLVAVDTDAAGTIGTSAPVDCVLDTGPKVTISSAGGTTAQPTQSVYGTVSAPAIEPATIGTAVTIYDNGAAAGTATVLSGGAWAANITLVNGANTITAADTDAAGITGTSNSVSYTLAIPPVVSITSPSVLLSSAVQTVSGTVAPGGAAIAGTTVKLYDNGASSARPLSTPAGPGL